MDNLRKQVLLDKAAAQTATKTDPAKWEQAKRDAKARMGGKHSAVLLAVCSCFFVDSARRSCC